MTTWKKERSIELISFAIKQAKEAVKFGFSPNECCRNLEVALHHYWQNKVLGQSGIFQRKLIPRSKAALNKSPDECTVEHVVPMRVFVKTLMNFIDPDDKEKIQRFLERCYLVRMVTIEENKKLTESGLRFKMPEEWNWESGDVFARHKKIGIEESS